MIKCWTVLKSPWKSVLKNIDKLGLSCAKFRPANYPQDFGSFSFQTRLLSWVVVELWQQAKLEDFIQREKWKKLSNGPLFGSFSRKNKNCSSFARTPSALRGSFFAKLITFERRSGLNRYAPPKISILKLWWLSTFQSHMFWGDDNLSFGAAQAPPTKMGSTIDLRLINFDNNHKWLFQLLLKLTQPSWVCALAELGSKVMNFSFEESKIQTIPCWFSLRIKKFIVLSDTKANSA